MIALIRLLFSFLKKAFLPIGIGFGYIIDFIFEFIKRKSESFPFFVSVLFINSLIFSSFLGYSYLVVKLILFLYEKINYFIDFINTFSSSGSDVVSLAFNILSSIQFFKAFHDVWIIFSPFINSIFLIISFIYGVKVLVFVRNSILSLVISKLT